MRPFLAFLTVVLLCAGIFSCKKSNDSSTGGGGSVQGNWKFLYLTAQTSASSSAGGLTDVTKSNYTTIDNGGTITFTADSMVVTGLTYSANITATVYIYTGGTLLDSTSQTLLESFPATNETAAYKQIGNDSLYLPGGTSTTYGTTVAQSSHYVINKDTLKITSQESETVSGVAETGIETIYLLKQ